jgi:hypothetical protein
MTSFIGTVRTVCAPQAKVSEIDDTVVLRTVRVPGTGCTVQVPSAPSTTVVHRTQNLYDTPSTVVLGNTEVQSYQYFLTLR